MAPAYTNELQGENLVLFVDHTWNNLHETIRIRYRQDKQSKASLIFQYKWFHLGFYATKTTFLAYQPLSHTRDTLRLPTPIIMV